MDIIKKAEMICIYYVKQARCWFLKPKPPVWETRYSEMFGGDSVYLCMHPGVKHRFAKLEEMDTLPQHAPQTQSTTTQGYTTNNMMYSIYAFVKLSFK